MGPGTSSNSTDAIKPPPWDATKPQQNLASNSKLPRWDSEYHHVVAIPGLDSLNFQQSGIISDFKRTGSEEKDKEIPLNPYKPYEPDKPNKPNEPYKPLGFHREHGNNRDSDKPPGLSKEHDNNRESDKPESLLEETDASNDFLSRIRYSKVYSGNPAKRQTGNQDNNMKRDQLLSKEWEFTEIYDFDSDSSDSLEHRKSPSRSSGRSPNGLRYAKRSLMS